MYEPSLLFAEDGCKKTGVIGGEPGRVQSPPVRISEKTPSSHPSLMPWYVSGRRMPKKAPFTGVGSMSAECGGLSTELKLPEADNVGVAGI